MIRLSKEEFKKIGLCAVMLVGVMYAFFVFLLQPLGRKIETTKNSVVEIENQIDRANKQIRKARQVETKADEAQRTLDYLARYSPDGAPIAWFPPRMTAFFGRHKIRPVSTRLSTGGGGSFEPELEAFERRHWSIEMPKVAFFTLGKAIAALENEEPLVEIVGLDIESSGENVEFQHATLRVGTLLVQ